MNVVTSDKVTFANVMQIELTDDCIKKLADALKQKTGKWIIFPPCFEEICMCSNCKTKFKEAYQHRDTCPSCGAKMEVGE